MSGAYALTCKHTELNRLPPVDHRTALTRYYAPTNTAIEQGAVKPAWDIRTSECTYAGGETADIHSKFALWDPPNGNNALGYFVVSDCYDSANGGTTGIASLARERAVKQRGWGYPLHVLATHLRFNGRPVGVHRTRG